MDVSLKSLCTISTGTSKNEFDHTWSPPASVASGGVLGASANPTQLVPAALGSEPHIQGVQLACPSVLAYRPDPHGAQADPTAECWPTLQATHSFALLAAPLPPPWPGSQLMQFATAVAAEYVPGPHTAHSSPAGAYRPAPQGLQSALSS